jgi:hypothetical protein
LVKEPLSTSPVDKSDLTEPGGTSTLQKRKVLSEGILPGGKGMNMEEKGGSELERKDKTRLLICPVPLNLT